MPSQSLLSFVPLMNTPAITNSNSTLDTVLTDGGSEAEDIIKQIQNRHNQARDIHGRQVLEADHGDGPMRTTVEVWEKPSGKYREEIRFADHKHDFEGDLVINDGAKIWKYSAEKNIVQIYEIDDNPHAEASSLASTDIISSMIEDSFDVRYEGTATVADRNTDILGLTPTDNADEFIQRYADIRLWVDQEYRYPLKKHFDMKLKNVMTSTTMMFEEIEFNTGFTDEVFEFDPPENADIKRQS